MGGGTPSNTTQTVTPWAGVQPYLLEAFQGLAETPTPEYFPGSTVAPQSATTQAGVQQLTNAAGTQQQMGQDVASGMSFTLNDMLNPATNKYLQQYAEAAIKPIFDKLNTSTISGIDDAAIQSGQFGGTAMRNLRSDAIDKASQAAMDTTAGMYSNAYQTALDNYTKTLLGAPSMMSAATMPAQTTLAAGGITDAYNQANINEQIARWNFGQSAEMDTLLQKLNAYMGLPTGSQTVTQGGSTSPLQAALGGGAAGYGLQSMLELGAPGWGTGLGALLGILAN